MKKSVIQSESFLVLKRSHARQLYYDYGLFHKGIEKKKLRKNQSRFFLNIHHDSFKENLVLKLLFI